MVRRGLTTVKGVTMCPIWLDLDLDLDLYSYLDLDLYVYLKRRRHFVATSVHKHLIYN